MKVSICEDCPYSERRVWSQYYKPNGYHAIGMSHAYRYCTFHGKRCSEIRGCVTKQTIEEIRKRLYQINKDAVFFSGNEKTEYICPVDSAKQGEKTEQKNEH